MANVKIKLDKQGIIEMLQSDDIMSEVEKYAQKECASHPHHHVRSFVGFDRAKAILYLNTKRYPK